MACLAPHFSTNRTVREYTEQHYLPAASVYHERSADNGASGVQMFNWRKDLKENWAALRFGDMEIKTDGDRHLFEVQVYLDDLDPEAVHVELYANGINGNAAERIGMTRELQLTGDKSGYTYRAQVPAARTAEEYTARLIPHHNDVAVPLEDAHILWQR